MEDQTPTITPAQPSTQPYPQPPIPYPTIQSWKSQCKSSPSPFLAALPKVELHVHIEGTLSPSLRFRLAKKHDMLPIYSARLEKHFWTEEELEREVYGGLLGVRSVKGRGVSAFFEAYYGGMEVLKTSSDFYDLAMGYFQRAKEMNIRYAEIMFDIQAHTRRGISVDTVMSGLERAKDEAERDLDISSTYVANFLRDVPASSALTHYNDLLPYRHLISGIGLDSNEFENPPSKFASLFALARKDGFKLTSHCDVAQPATLANIRYVATELGGTGAERIDHGLDAGQDDELIAEIVRRGTGMTICPWAYVRHHTEANIFGWIRRLLEKGVKMSIACDSPEYVEGNYLVSNLALLMLVGGWKENDCVDVMKTGVEMCWAQEEVKERLKKEIASFSESWKGTS